MKYNLGAQRKLNDPSVLIYILKAFFFQTKRLLTTDMYSVEEAQ